ncbi:DUF2520 domain-containing protein [Sulfidibacter corallicola]|uniref:DUF2520 domain-containing protein n=1 Tax=Sulfidibacter corallicola TaxID=2818388 RepID=A0A8A4THK9_SULCO|nr:DUF2520 domain-containing protein [Sulfidibacter corallicola]QTD48248.1 DUF2520 domain-containing protein [Sulfidibacter corallicola]
MSLEAELPGPTVGPVGVWGIGRLGSSLVASLRALDLDVRERRRDGDRPLSRWVEDLSVVCLAVQDGALTEVVEALREVDVSGRTVLVLSGATALDVLAPLRKCGATVGKLHPLQTFTRVAYERIPPGTHFAIEGPIRELVAPWVEAWDGVLHELSGDDWKVYHLAAVVAANFLPLFIRAGAGFLRPLARDDQDALNWLEPLVSHSVAAALDGAKDLPYSGPAIRGDRQTLDAHERLLEGLRPEWLPIYRLASALIAEEGRKRLDG